MTGLPENDYVSQINRNGSGLNIPQIVGALVDVNIEPQKAPVLKEQEKVEAAISGLAILKNSSELTNKNIEKLKSANFYSTTSSDAAQIVATVETAGLVKPGISKISSISQIAQSMSFSIPATGTASSATQHYATANAGLPSAYSLTIIVGATFTDNSSGADAIAVDASATTTNLTLASGEGIITVARKLDAIAGISARVVNVDTGKFKILVTSETGENNAFDINTGIDSGNGDNRAFDTWENRPGGAGTQTLRSFDQSAQDLKFKLNGLDVERESNTVTDAIPGVKFEIKVAGGTGAEIKTEFSKTTIQSTVQKFIDELNAYKADLNALVAYDRIGDVGNGELYGDAYAKSRIAALNAFMLQPIMGYTSLDKSHYDGSSYVTGQRDADSQRTGSILAIETRPVFLAQLGFKTQKDGTYALDQSSFDTTFNNSPSNFDALVNDHAYSIHPDIKVLWDGRTALGSAERIKNGGSVGAIPGIIQINSEDGDIVSTRGIRHAHAYHGLRTGPVNGVYSWVGKIQGSGSDKDDLTGLTLTSTRSDIGDDIPIDVHLGKSFSTLFSEFHDVVLNNTYEHRRQAQNYDTKRESFESRLAAIELRSNSLAQSYNKQFQAMEQSVTGFNSTGDFLTNFVDQWNK